MFDISLSFYLFSQPPPVSVGWVERIRETTTPHPLFRCSIFEIWWALQATTGKKGTQNQKVASPPSVFHFSVVLYFFSTFRSQEFSSLCCVIQIEPIFHDCCHHPPTTLFDWASVAIYVCLGILPGAVQFIGIDKF